MFLQRADNVLQEHGPRAQLREQSYVKKYRMSKLREEIQNLTILAETYIPRLYNCRWLPFDAPLIRLGAIVRLAG